MAGISDDSGFSLGLANIAASNYGPNAVASQANTNANTDVARAEAANTGQAVQAATMQNQLMRARMPLILSALHGEAATGGGDDSGVGGAGDTSAPKSAAEKQQSQEKSGTAGTGDDGVPKQDQSFYDPDKIDTALRAKYFVPTVTDQEKAALKRSYLVDPENKYGMGPQSVIANREMRVTQQTQQSQVDSQNSFDALHAVTDAPEGNAMDVLEASHPETVAAIRRKFEKDPDAAMEEDAAARMFASHVAGNIHQYTGRKAVKDDAGVYRDEATGIPIPGVEKVGLSTDQYIRLAHEALTPSVEIDDGNGGKIKVAPWRAAQMAGAKNINGPGDWMMVRASQQGLPGAAATTSPNSAQKQAARAAAQEALTKVTKAREAQGTPTPTNGAPAPKDGIGTARNAQGNIDTKLTDALHDESFTYKPSNNGVPYEPQIGHTPPPAVQDDMKNQTAARDQLAKETNAGVGAAAAALTMYKAAQDVLAKGNYDGGAWNAELAKYSKWLPAGWQTHMTGDYQEVAKYLGNAALQSGKGIFAKMTEKESDAVMHDLNPSPNMDPDALRDMIGRGIKTADYSLASAKRVPAYLAARKDAKQFSTWNQTHFPMEEETKETPKAAPKYNDAQVKAYAAKHGYSEEAVRKALGLK